MNIQHYLNKKNEIYDYLLNFVNDEISLNNQNVLDFFESLNFQQSPEELKEFLYMISKISKNHYRGRYFFSKIVQILSYFENEIKCNFSNSEIFGIFSNNKQILLYFFEKKIIVIDESIVKFMLEKGNKKYCHFFYPEMKLFSGNSEIQVFENELLQIDPNIFSNFEEKRRAGENDSYLCELIRKDSVEDFISHVNQANISLSTQVNLSIFETNSFLVEKHPTLIEYASFFGSIQIFQYLQMNDVKLTSSLWLYAIHSNNAELIHLLEENYVEPENNNYEKCFEEAIKCHHNEVAIYIRNNLIDENSKYFKMDNNFRNNIFECSLHYHNYAFFPEEFTHKFIFYYLCEYDYFYILKCILKTEQIDINASIFDIKQSIKFNKKRSLINNNEDVLAVLINILIQ